MRRHLVAVLLFVLATSQPVATQTSSSAASSDNARWRQALRTPTFETFRVDVQADWARVERLPPGTQVTVIADSQVASSGRLVSADATGLSFTPAGAPSSQRIRREAVIELRAHAGRRGSKTGAIVGASAGAALGFLSAFVLSYKNCGGNCSDEQLLMGLSIVGLPVAGGLIGYYAFPGTPRDTTIYRR